MPDFAVHIALDRDQAKELFRQKEDAAVSAFVENLLATEPLPAGVNIRPAPQWQEIHRLLTGGDNAGDGEYPLNHAIRGGRPLHQGDEYIIALIRPDMPPHIAAALKEFDGGDLATELASLATFFEEAAAARQAVLFFVRKAV